MSKPTCFIIMPITTPPSLIEQYNNDENHFRHVLKHLFVPAIKKAEYEPIRPIAEGAEIIHAKIIEYLDKADLVLCDISAHNPNVFFELGIRVALNKPVAYIKDDKCKIPFDTTSIHHHTYNSSITGILAESQCDKLAEHLKKCPITNGNSLYEWYRIYNAAKSFEAGSESDDAIKYLMSKVDAISEAVNRSPERLTSKYPDNYASVHECIIKTAKSLNIPLLSIEGGRSEPFTVTTLGHEPEMRESKFKSILETRFPNRIRFLYATDH